MALVSLGQGTRHIAEESFMPPFPPGQKITTQLPANIALIRIAVTLFFTACVIAKSGLTVWSWPVVILGTGFTAYTAYKHLLTKDPLVEAFYKFAGSKEKFDALPVFPLDPKQKICESIVAVQWNQLSHRSYQATTQDGRKVMVVKEKKEGRPPSIIAFVEKLGLNDTPRAIPSLNEWVESLLIALPIPTCLENPCSKVLGYGSPITETSTISFGTQGTCTQSETITPCYEIKAEILTDMANHFVAQNSNGAENRI